VVAVFVEVPNMLGVDPVCCCWLPKRGVVPVCVCCVPNKLVVAGFCCALPNKLDPVVDDCGGAPKRLIAGFVCGVEPKGLGVPVVPDAVVDVFWVLALPL